MSLKHGRHSVAIPGPSVVPDRVLSAMHAAMPNIYEGAIVDLIDGLFADIGRIARTRGPGFIAIANGHGAWEMALTNVLARGDRVLVLESGRFAVGWGEMATRLGCPAEVLAGRPGRAVDPAAVEARLRADHAHQIRAILVVQIDTASSVLNDIPAIRRAIDAAGHPALLLVDCIASLGCVPYEMDAWGVDVTVAGSQKGLMVPPGLGFVWASDKALTAHARADLRTPYWDWTTRKEKGAPYLHFFGTPPVSHLYGLRAAMDMLFEEGIENVWARHRALAGAVRAAVEAWSSPGAIGFYVAEPAERSDAVTTVVTGQIDAGMLRRVAEEEAGLTLGVGLGPVDGLGFRIGHMGHLNPPMILGTLATVEAVLLAMDAPIGASGAAAAAAAIARATALGQAARMAAS